MTKKCIMITRPAHQADVLTQEVETAGGNAFLFPTLEIISAELTQESEQQLQQLNTFDIVIFISPNAVEYGLNHILSHHVLSDDILLATIGQGSAQVLHDKLGKQPDIVPNQNFNSEGLLATDAMRDVENKRILIIRGNGGREHLKNELQKRGAEVEYFCAYERLKPATNTHNLEQYLQNNQIAAIVITSATSLKNLLEMTPTTVTSRLLNVPLVLINKRLIDIAKTAGFNNDLLIAAEASDEAIILLLKEKHLI